MRFSVMLLLIALLPSNSFARNTLTYGEGADFSLPIVGLEMLEGLGSKKNDQSVKFLYPAQNELTIDAEKLGQCLARAAATSGFAPRMTKEGMVCVAREGGKLESKEHWPTSLEYLSGDTRSCDYSSGKEVDLKNWIMSQPDNSIEPIGMFQKALTLNSGNIQMAILTVHQVLRPFARWNKSERYGFMGEDVSQPDSAKMMNKLVDIRGDLWERDSEKFHGDHGGSWYRIWGAMLFQMGHLYSVEKSRVSEMGSCRTEIASHGFQDSINSVLNTMVFYGDEKIAKADSEVDAGKYEVDLAGTRSILSMRKALEGYRREADKPGPGALPSLSECQNRIYLKSAH